MSDGYELVEYQIDEQHKFWELKNSSHDQSELQKAIANRRLRESCNKLFLQLAKIIDYGVAVSCRTENSGVWIRRLGFTRSRVSTGSPARWHT